MSFPIGLLERNTTRLSFALMLRDGPSLSDQLVGDVGVIAAGRAGQRKDGSGTFLFFDLPNGATDFAVRSSVDTPYYLPTYISVTLPPAAPTWPAFPDIALADPTLALADPAQPAAYRSQFVETCLTPSTAYPFAPTATLLRGTVLHAGTPVAGVTLTDLAGAAAPGLSGADGGFVLAFPTPAASPANVTVRTHGGGFADVDTAIAITRAATTTVQITV